MEKNIKLLKKVLFLTILCLFILLLIQPKVSAETKNVNTIEELKTIFEENAIIEENTIKLTDNVILKNDIFDIKIPELIVDFNGKNIECSETAGIRIYNKIIFKDSSTTNRLDWGGFIFNNKSSSSINVNINAELIINSGKFVDGGSATTGGKIYVAGKLIINDATFSTIRTDPAYEYNYMISLSYNSECIINSGEFSHTDTIIYVGGSKYSNNCELIINGGNFNCSYGDAIKIYTFYPYVNADGNEEVITPKIILNNCNIKAEHTAIGFWGGCTDEKFKNTDTQILTILGGTYQSSKQNYGSPLEIRTYADPYTYFNPKDFVLKGGTFETLSDGLGAIRLLGPRKR